jgi:hypothetical protein
MRDNGSVDIIDMPVYVGPRDASLASLPSLIGRDLLDHFVMTFDQRHKTLTLD